MYVGGQAASKASFRVELIASTLSSISAVVQLVFEKLSLKMGESVFFPIRVLGKVDMSVTELLIRSTPVSLTIVRSIT